MEPRKFQQYIFDEALAARAVRFVESCCFLSKGKDSGKPLKLRPWQRKIIEDIFGWIDPSTGLRRYRKVFIFLPRKNGKSHIAAAIAALCLYADNEPGADIVLAATTREQASIVYHAAAGFIRQSPVLQPLSLVVPSTKRVAVPSTNSTLRALSAEAPTALGLDVHALIYDEIAFAPSRDLYDALTTASGGRRQPLQVFITTAGWDHEGIGYQLYQYAKSVLSDESFDPQFLPIIFEVSDKADWSDEAEWHRSNPALGDFLSLDELRAVAREALNSPAEQNKFRMFHCNQWVSAAESWLDVTKWSALASEPDEEELRTGNLYLGLDLSSNTDASALACLWAFPNNRYYLRVHLFLPEDDLRNRVLRDHAPYDLWSQENHLNLTPGSEVDYGFIRKTIDTVASEFKVSAVCYDPWHAHDFIQRLENDGFLCVKVRQGHESMGAPTKEFAGAITGGRIAHDGNPMMDWMIGNVTTRADANGNIVPDKKRSRHRIDGVAASIIAMAAAQRMQVSAPVKPKAEFRMHVLV